MIYTIDIPHDDTVPETKKGLATEANLPIAFAKPTPHSLI